MSKYKRVLLKLSGEALAGDKGTGFDEAPVYRLQNRLKIWWMPELKLPL